MTHVKLKRAILSLISKLWMQSEPRTPVFLRESLVLYEPFFYFTHQFLELLKWGESLNGIKRVLKRAYKGSEEN